MPVTLNGGIEVRLQPQIAKRFTETRVFPLDRVHNGDMRREVMQEIWNYTAYYMYAVTRNFSGLKLGADGSLLW